MGMVVLFSSCILSSSPILADAVDVERDDQLWETVSQPSV